MPAELPGASEPQRTALTELAALRSFVGPPKEFWPRYLSGLASLTGASKVTLLLQDPGQGQTQTQAPGQPQTPGAPPVGAWKRLSEWPVTLPPSRWLTTFSTQLEEMGARCLNNGGSLLVSLDPSAPRGAGHFAIAARIRLYRAAETCVALLLLSEIAEGSARETLLRLNMAADVPESYQMNQAILQASADVQKLAVAQDLMIGVNAEKRFVAAALAFCNGLATSFQCQRVALGWLQGGYVRLRAISRTEKFDRQLAAPNCLEAAMEETLDQDEEILWPPLEGANVVSRDHEKYATDQKSGHLCSLPLRLEGQPVAVLTCEREGAAFTPTEVQQLRLCGEQATRRLADLHRHDRWPGARLAAWSKDQLALVIGPKHTWAKALSLLGVVALVLLFIPRFPYRVEGNFVLKSDDVSFRTAPFDGYIEQVFARPGDAVKAGERLFKLVTRELEIEESAAQADWGRYLRESEKARATNGLSEMRVALALADQAQARLDLVRYRLGEAILKAPFDGVVVEGDLRERLAAPVKQGDALMKVARIEKLYVEAEISERDVHEILDKQRGEIAFVSQPQLKFPVRITRIEPAAFPRQEGNVFLVRCEFDQVEKWWRPGMSGLCKLGVEGRTLWWIVTHRTVDFLRMKLWW